MAGNLIMVLPIISNHENSFNGYDSLNCRSILYKTTSDNKGKDLIYKIPTNYDIDTSNINEKNDMSFYITAGLELKELLKYLKFKKDLTEDDLNKIQIYFLNLIV